MPTTSDAEDKTCRKFAICLWDGGQGGDDVAAKASDSKAVQLKMMGVTRARWTGGDGPELGGIAPMDVIWRFFQWSVSRD
jgi:hypothetical protein